MLIILQVNIIVNLTNKDADLSLGFVSQSLLNVAGSEIQNDLLANFPWGMGDDDVAVMGGRKLTCDLLIHGCLEKWNPQNPEASKEVCNFISDLVGSDFYVSQREMIKTHQIGD